ncbi:MAG: alpha/beta hydrolase [Chloroflexi bacterium]|nr:alpha/beta hydrolase [Chloroflexota bacterium]
MARVQLDPTLDMYYEDDNFTDPWTTPEVVLLQHGMAESGQVWWRWVPHLAQRYRVIRPDFRGLGRSSTPPPDYEIDAAGLTDDLARLLDHLGVERVHYVGAKVGGTLGTVFVHRFPERVRSFTTLGTPFRYTYPDAVYGDWAELVGREGMRAWAESTMGSRLGEEVSREMYDWWIDLMGRTDAATAVRLFNYVKTVDLEPVMPLIQTPTLVVTAAGSRQSSLDRTLGWFRLFPNARLAVLPNDSYHVAATHPDECRTIVTQFLSGVERTA